MFETEKVAPKPPRAPPADKPLDAPVTQAQLRKQLNLSFNAVARILKLPWVPEEVSGPEGILRFEEEEFDAAATGFIVIVGEHSDLRRLVRLMGPLAGVMELLTVLDRFRIALAIQTEQRKLAKQQAEWAKQAAREAQAATEAEMDQAIRDRFKNPLGR